MNKNKIILVISFFIVAYAISWGLFLNKDSFLNLKQKDAPAKIEKISEKKEDVVIKKEIKCEGNLNKYKNDVLGIEFCYSKDWGKVSIEPVENLTLLESTLEEYSADVNNIYKNSLFIKFERGDVQMHIFNENYEGEHYPNSLAYEKGYIDNVADLKKTKNICDYRISFTELWEYQGRMTEFWSQCENRIKTQIIKHEQYFDKNLYSYELNSVSYLNLQNKFFDNVLITKKYLQISQVEKKINDETQIFEAKDYPSQVDNSKVISQDEYINQKEEFGQFLSSISSYPPVVSPKADFQEMPDEDKKVTLIRKYYWLLENQKIEEAYQMHNRINISLDDFRFSYKKTNLSLARDFKKINDNTYKFFLDYQDHNKPKTVFRITIRITNEDKLEIISTEEIVTEMVKVGNYVAYAKKQNGKVFMVLERYGIETVVDEGVANYDEKHSNLEAVKFFSDIKFSKNDNYLIYRVSGWEWSTTHVYEINAEKNVLEFGSGFSGFSRDEKSFFVCNSSGMATSAEGTIYTVPEFKKNFALFNSENTTVVNVECSYDDGKNELTFVYDDGCEDGKCKKTEVVYSFDENKMIRSRIVDNGV